MSDPEDLSRAQLLVARGELGQARSALERLLVREPENLPALLLAATVCQELRDGEQALALCQRAVDLVPRSSEALNGQARCLHALGRDDEALEVAERARALLDEGDNFRQGGAVFLTLVWCLREQRRYREALALAEEGLERWPDAVLAQWATTVEQELAEAQRERC